MIGRRLAHYEITELLGEGGMGSVYRARDTRLDRDVALKVLSAELAADTAFLERFDREAKIVAGLNHPHVVHVYSVEEAGGLRFLTMELVEGEEVSARLPRDGMELDEVLEIGIAVADALVEAHAKAVVHRDLKPGNLMITREGRVKVLDFGLAKSAAATLDAEDATQVMDLTRQGAVLGTVPYMSPEQVRGQEVDARSDLFSLGIVLHELATGARPFTGATPADVGSSILKDHPCLPSTVRPDLPAGLDAIITRCLQKDADDRPASARELLDALRALRRELDSGITSGAGGVAPSSRRHGPVRAVVGAAVLLAVVAGAWFVLRGGGSGSGPTARPIVAVLPFENLGADGDAAFAAGITDEITSRLTRIEGLGVISRTSARRYVDSGRPVADVGRELGAEYVLEGAIRWDRTREPGRVRINTRLVGVDDDTYLWSKDFERELTEIFAVQASIAANIADALDVRLLAPVRARLDERPTSNIDAYEAYLQGWAQLQAPRFGREGFELGIRMFERAIALDPDFAHAYAGLASMHARMVHYGYDLSEERRRLAKNAADTAVRLGPDLAVTHLARGNVHYWAERDYEAALAELETAASLDPNDSGIWLTMAYVERRQGNMERALSLFERDLALSPRDPNVTIGMAETFVALRRYDEAEEAFRRAIDLAPGDPYPYTELALVHLRDDGDAEAARAVLATRPPVDDAESRRVDFLVELLDRDLEAALGVLDESPDPQFEAGAFFLPIDLLRGSVLALRRERDAARAAYERARAMMQPALDRTPDDPRLHAALGMVAAGLGRAAEAIRHGERAVELRPVASDALAGPVLLESLAWIHAELGQTERALGRLRELLSIPGPFSVSWLAADPRWDGLRDAPGYAGLLEAFASD